MEEKDILLGKKNIQMDEKNILFSKKDIQIGRKKIVIRMKLYKSQCTFMLSIYSTVLFRSTRLS